MSFKIDVLIPQGLQIVNSSYSYHSLSYKVSKMIEQSW